LAEAAARLFFELGYNRVGVDDIAATVGITGGAVYRHYRGKRELLARVLFDRLATLRDMIDVEVADRDPVEHLDRTIDLLVEYGLGMRDFATLAVRETRHLKDDDRAKFVRQIAAVSDRLARTIDGARPELDPADALVAAEAALAVSSSPSFHAVALPRARSDALLREATNAVVHTASLPRAAVSAPIDPVAMDPKALAWLRRSSRRESLLHAAIQLFGSRGYGAVRMEDIGAAAGISGPSIYEHFPGKPDLLVAALWRGAEWLELNLTSALASSATPEEALGRVVASYAAFLLEHPMIARVTLTESVYLPDDERHALRRTQREYVGQWVVLLTAVRPELTDAEARFVVHAVLSLFNNLPRSPRFRARGDAEVLLVDLASDVLGLRARSESPT
jgi:AcrR family transcriptional regulator